MMKLISSLSSACQRRVGYWLSYLTELIITQLKKKNSSCDSNGKSELRLIGQTFFFNNGKPSINNVNCKYSP